MAVKFSQFDGTVAPSKTSTTQYIVGFEGNTNIKWTMKDIADEIGGGSSIYTANGTIGDTAGSDIRTVTIGGTTQANSNHIVLQPPNPANWGNKTGPLLVKGNANDVAGFGVYNSAAQISGYNIRFLTNASYSDLGKTLTQAGTINQQGKWTISGDVGIGGSYVANQRLTIKGSGLTNTTTALAVQNSGGADIFNVTDDGEVKIESNISNYTGFRIKASNGSTGIDQTAYISDNYSGATLQDIKPFLAKRSTSGTSNRDTLFLGPASSTNVGYNNAGHTVVNGPWQGGTPSFNTTAAYFAPMIQSSMFIAGGGNETGLFIGSGGQDSSHYALQVRSDNAHINGNVWFQLRGDDRIVYTDGNEAAGKVLTCDANGVATWQTAGSGDNIYTIDGVLSGNRIVTLGNNTLSFTTAGNGAVKLDSPVSVSRNPSLSVSMYIQGQGATSSTRSLLLENSNGAYMMSVKDDGQITIGSGATIQSTSNPQYSVVMGYGAKDIASAGNAAESVAIGRLAAGNANSVAIGGQAKGSGSSSVAVGAQAQAKATGTSIGFQAGGASAGSSAVSIGKFAQAQANGSIAIGANTGLTGANSIVLNATTGVTASTAADTFEIFMTSTSTPDFTIKGTTGGNQAKFVGQVSVGLKSSAAIDGINWDEGNIQEVTLASGANDFDPINEVPGSTYILKITQPSSADGTIDWESTTATVNWPGGTAPTLTAGNGAVDIVTLVCTAANTYYGTSALNFS